MPKVTIGSSLPETNSEWKPLKIGILPPQKERRKPSNHPWLQVQTCLLASFLSGRVHTCHDSFTVHQWLFLVPLKGGLGSIFHPPEGKDYMWYISGIFPANWGVDYATYRPPFRGNQQQPPLMYSEPPTGFPPTVRPFHR